MAESILHSGGFVDRYGNEITVEFYTRTPTHMTVNKNQLNFSASAGSTDTLIVSGYSGTLSINVPGNWLSYSVSTVSGVRTYTFTALENTTTSQRNVTITLYDSDETLTVSAVQAAGEGAWAVSPTSFEYAGSGATNTFTFVNSPSRIGYTIPSGIDWVTVSNLTTSSVKITAAASQSPASRTTTVTFYDQDNNSRTVTVTVNQEAGVDSLTLSKSTISLGPAATHDGFTATWTAGTEPTATVEYVQGDPGWIYSVTGSVDGNQKVFTLGFSSNYDSSSRTARVRVTNGLQTETVAIVQTSGPSPAVLTVSPSSLYFNRGRSGSQTITVMYSGEVTTQVGSDVTIESVTPIAGGYEYTVSMTLSTSSLNPTSSSYITFTGGQTSQTVNIYGNYMNVVPSETNISGEGGAVSSILVYYTNVSTQGIQVYEKSNFITNVSTVNTSTNVREYSLQVSSNTTAASRSGYVEFRGVNPVEGGTGSSWNKTRFVVYQDAAHAQVLSAEPSGFDISADSFTSSIAVTYDGTLTTAATGGTGWMNYTSVGDSNGVRTYRLDVSANTSASRTADIEFEDSYDTIHVLVSQAAGSTPTPTPTPISLSPSSFTFPVEGGTGTLNVSSEQTVTFSLVPEWVTITPGTPSGGIQPFTITVGQNVGYARNQTIFVEDSTGTVTFTVSQAAATSTLATIPSEFSTFSYGYSGSNTISVTYNGSLSAIAYGTGWLSMSLVSSTSSMNTYNISVYENFHYTSRSGYLWFSDAMSFTTVPIYQAGAPTTVTVTPKSWIFSKGGGNINVTVSFNGSEPFYSTPDYSWLMLETGLLTSSGRQYTVYVSSSRFMTQSRQGIITWDDGNGGIDYFTAIQIPNSVVMASPSSLEYGYSGGTSLVTVSFLGYNDIGVSVPASASEWLSAVSYSSSSYTRVFSVTALGPNLGGDRTTDLIFTASNSTVSSIPVTQYSLAPATYLYAVDPSYHFGSASDHSNMTVYFSGTLTSSASGDYEGVVKWLLCDRIAANTGSNTYVINVRSNTTGVSRTGYLYFHDDGNDEDIMVTVDQDS